MGFISKILREQPKQNEEKVMSYQPRFAHLNSYKTVQNRALIGWIAARCAEALKMDVAEREALFMTALNANSLDDVDDEKTKELLLLANNAVTWIESNAVIEEEMKAINPTFSSKDVLRRVFNEVQMDVKDKEYSQSENEKIWEVYRDVIYAATEGRFLLISKNDLDDYKKGELICSSNIVERSDIPKARNAAKEAFSEKGIKASKAMSYNLIISEAITNILKHAESGKMLIYHYEDLFHVIVEDKGPGFPLKILPKTTLMAGFSTKESLGQGFTLMMKMAEQVVLETSTEGSTLILLLNARKEEVDHDNGQ